MIESMLRDSSPQNEIIYFISFMKQKKEMLGRMSKLLFSTHTQIYTAKLQKGQ